MTNTAAQTTRQRSALSRQLILETALRYIDRHGLEALSMHKLGAELGVKGMSLYNHVDNKDDVLDGVLELLWTEAERLARPLDDWRDSWRLLARTLRNVVHRHPNAASLLTTRQVMSEAALRTVRDHITTAVRAGVGDDYAHSLLRTITSYALGYALAYVSWGTGCDGCVPSVNDLLRPGTPSDLAEVARIFCGQADPDAQFELGLDLMLRNPA